MMGALLYLHFTSSWNRLVSRLKRLKQPKYLIGGIVGGIYIYFYFFRVLFLGPRSGQGDISSWFTPENMRMIECGAGLALCVIILLSWVVPNKRAALTFTEAEIAFLFSAPVTRRTLIQFKLLRSQLGILFTVLIFTLISRRVGGNALIHALGWWLILSVLNLHFMGVSFLRTQLLDRGITNWTRRVVLLTIVGGVLAGIGFWVWKSLPAMTGVTSDNPAQLVEYFRLLVASGPIPLLLFPFRLLVRPYLTENLGQFVLAAWPAFLILAAHYWWVIRSDVAFEEASVEASRKLSERVAAARAGKLRSGAAAKPRRAPFNLNPQGSPAVALFWKNLIGSGQLFNKRLVLILTLMTVFAGLAMAQGSMSHSVVAILGILAMMLLAWSILLGPQVLSQDLRQDLKMADVIKLYPMKGWQVVLGELLAPAVILTVIQWLLIPLAVGGLLNLDRKNELQLSTIIGFAIALAIMAPTLNLLSFVIPNTSVLLLPAWFQTDKAVPHGIETMGQRIVLLFGQLLVLLVSALPAGVVFTAVLLVVKWAVGWAIAAPIAGVAAAAVIALEVSVAVLLMGRWFEKLDVSKELGS